MKQLIMLTLLLCGFVNSGVSQTAYSQSLSCNKGTFALGYAQQLIKAVG